jgi:hypothetical protein
MIQIAPGCIVCPHPIDSQKRRHACTVPIVTESRSKHTAQIAYVHNLHTVSRGKPPSALTRASYSNAKIRFQSFFMLMTVQPSLFASS